MEEQDNVHDVSNVEKQEKEEKNEGGKADVRNDAPATDVPTIGAKKSAKHETKEPKLDTNTKPKDSQSKSPSEESSAVEVPDSKKDEKGDGELNTDESAGNEKSDEPISGKLDKKEEEKTRKSSRRGREEQSRSNSKSGSQKKKSSSSSVKSSKKKLHST
mmetsp:Transcript_12060/g.15771  ORF Transcript_12060/g.15771 Transcript_12060/m.15771 type:complete len:160 (+) Transcript_12060:101-580(+)